MHTHVCMCVHVSAWVCALMCMCTEGLSRAPPAKMPVVLAAGPLLSHPRPSGVTGVSLPLRTSSLDLLLLPAQVLTGRAPWKGSDTLMGTNEEVREQSASRRSAGCRRLRVSVVPPVRWGGMQDEWILKDHADSGSVSQ